MKPILSVRGLCKNYPGFSLDQVSFTLPEGSIMGFVGENGAGKTTTLKLIMDLLRRDSGDISVFGMDPAAQGAAVRAQTGVVLDDGFFHDFFRPADIERVLRGLHKDWDSGLWASYLQKLRIPKDKTCKEMSRGTKKKLALAAALAHRPRLLLLDEATSGLDPVVRDEILDMLMEFIQDEHRSVLLSSHITSDLEKICDYITFIHDGRIIFCEERDRLYEKYGILKCPAEVIDGINPALLVGVRRGRFGCEALLRDRGAQAANRPGSVIEPASIEQIMLFYAKDGAGRTEGKV